MKPSNVYFVHMLILVKTVNKNGRVLKGTMQERESKQLSTFKH